VDAEQLLAHDRDVRVGIADLVALVQNDVAPLAENLNDEQENQRETARTDATADPCTAAQFGTS
jgi:hypothetical protein